MNYSQARIIVNVSLWVVVKLIEYADNGAKAHNYYDLWHHYKAIFLDSNYILRDSLESSSPYLT